MRTDTDPTRAAHPALEDELDLSVLTQLLRRRARLIAGTVLAVLALAGAYLVITPPTYTAQALILFDPAQKDLLEDDPDRSSAQSDNARIDSEVEILRSPAIALSVIARANLLHDPAFGPAPGPRALTRLGLVPAPPDAQQAALKATVLRLQAATHVQRRGQTYLIAVQVSAPQPEQAAHLTNLLAETYIAAQLDAKVAASLGARDVLQARIEAGRSAVTQADAALDQFLRQHRAFLGDHLGDLPARLAASDLPPDRLAQVFGLEQEAAIARTQYQTLLSRLRDLEAQARLQLADSRVVSAAMVPNAPSTPDARLVLIVALIAGLALGLGLALLRDQAAGGITRPAQMRALLQAPVASCVPYLGLDRRLDASVADTVLRAPMSAYAEAIRRLRVSLDHGFRARGGAATEGRVVMITSPGASAGKTSLALALARLYALSGKKTVLLDADLRHPGVQAQVGLQPRHGVLEYLRAPAEGAVAGALFSRDPLSPLALVLGAEAATQPTDQLIGSATFQMLLRDLRARYDRVVIDTAPLQPVVDTRLILPLADAVVMTARAGHTGRADLRAAVQMLAEAVRPGVDVYGVLSHQPMGTGKDRYAGGRATGPQAPALNPL